MIAALLLGGCALFAASPAHAIYAQTCFGTDPTPQVTIAPIAFQISRQTPVGSFIGDWYASLSTPAGSLAGGPIGPFIMCTNRQQSGQNAGGATQNIYVGGDRPGTVYPAPGNMTVTDGGVVYRVFTNAALEQIGVGYIIRWRVTNGFGEFGTWVTPPANWSAHMPPAAAGLPFYRFWTYRQNAPGTNIGQHIQGFAAPTNVMTSLQGWYNMLNQYAGQYPNANYVLIFGAEIASRYVLIKDPLTIPGAQPLDPVTQTISLQLELLRARPNYYQNVNGNITINQNITLTLPPTGTCTTPSFPTVAFGTLFENGFPVQGSAGAYKSLNLTFTNCPRINIGYYVHANGKWVNSNQGIVGLSGSTPNANPAVGNPRGFGVQLAHNGGPQGTGNLYISPNVDDANKQIYWRTPAQGTNTAAGVNHTIALRARVIRTHPTGTPIVPGPFNTSVIVVVQYQ